MLETEETENFTVIEEVHHEDPKVLTYSNFVTRTECEHLIEVARPHFEDSVVSDNRGGHKSMGRTSQTAWVDHYHDKTIENLAKRIAEKVNIPLENAERFQVVYYKTTNEYRPHYDSWDHDGSQKTLRCIRMGGPRMVTALVYLNEVEEGGSTRFTKLDIDVKPEMGKLLVFGNTKKDSIDKHPLSEHAGTPVIKGEKYICNLWFRQYNRSKLYSDFNPGYYDKIKSASFESIETNNVTLTSIHDKKNIKKQDNVFTEDDCKKIISLGTFSDASIPSAWLTNTEHKDLIMKICLICGTVPEFLENMNVVKYSGKKTHGPFLDAYDLYTDRGKTNTKSRGQRLQTISICLNNSLMYEFDALKLKVIMRCGSLLTYNNVEKSRQRDNDVSHRVLNMSDEDTYLLNIYVREKNRTGDVNPLFKLKDIVLNQENIRLETQEVKPDTEDYVATYKNVLQQFKENKVNTRWRGHNSFKYTFRGDFQYFKDCVCRFEECSSAGRGLNKEHLDTKFEFDEYKGVNLSNIVHDDMLVILKEYYRKTISSNVFALGDKQSKRFKAHNEPMSRFLHYEILPLIENIAGRKLRPTYTYLSSYTKDSDLPGHTDRADCEYTISFLVNKDVDWPIYLHKVKQPVKHKGRSGFNPDKSECVELHGDINGLIMFSGTDHIHFREKYDGEFYDILLLHYCTKE